ncbi:MAG: sulfite exporter TauE/SafE family protein [Chitinophagaceae bacterium]|nr:sulfite exporter TauE/SafE family protein [Chitinophagaceae bacterium]
MEIAGYVAAIFAGVVLGLIGGGGSILTVPILVYLFGIAPVLATGYSLFIVGSTSTIGAYSYFKRDLVHLSKAIAFGIPSIIAVFVTRAVILPAIPDVLLTAGSFTLTKNLFLMLLFSLLMLGASYNMIKKKKEHQTGTQKKSQHFLLILNGLFIGLLTGLVGVGGGFLIVPALVLLSRMPMKEAIGTSLTIIAANALIGFLGERNLLNFDWKLLLSVTAFTIAGIFIGIALSKKISGAKLKPAFGWFILAMGVYIIIKETFL